jgi:tRNA pseudouridine55 synthase
MKKEITAMDFEAGEVLLIDKPKGWTSFDVVKKIRGAVKIKKVGHAGTLDPLATGLLIVCTGKKTKSIQEIQDADKEYTTDFRLGATTPSYDAEFPPENQKDCSHLTADDIRQAMPAFLGALDQMPPVFSAIWVDGQRAYKAARAGKEIEMKTRPVRIDAFELTDFQAPDFASVRIECGKGTYIRSLVHDLGQVLGVGAYIEELRRTRIGTYHVDHAWGIEEFCSAVRASRAAALEKRHDNA